MAFVLAVPLCFLRKARYFVQEVLECIVSSDRWECARNELRRRPAASRQFGVVARTAGVSEKFKPIESLCAVDHSARGSMKNAAKCET